MQSVTQEWKNNQEKTLVNEGFIKLTYHITDPDALEDASASDNGSVFISNTAQTVSEVDKNIVNYAMLERSSWTLDGGKKIIPDQAPYGDTGFISGALSGSDCNFQSPYPKVNISFTSLHEPIIPGLTIIWSEVYSEYADTFIVSAYSGENVVAQKTVTGNRSTTSIVQMDIQGYDNITIEVIKWCSPFHRARITEIYVGINKVFTKSDLVSFTHTQNADPLSASLPKSEITFKLRNLNDEYNFENPTGLSKYMVQRQEIELKYGYRIDTGIEWISGGTFYLSDWESPQNGITVQFKARDLLEFLNADYTDNTTGSISLYDLAVRILTQADLPLADDGSVKWIIDDSLRSIYTTVRPTDSSLAESLQKIANAGCCALYQDRNGILRIAPVSSTVSDYIISRDNSYKNAELTLSKPLQAVSAQYGGASPAIVTNSSTGEIQTVDNELVNTETDALRVGGWVKDYLKNRTAINGEWRADPRLDALDLITCSSKYSNSTVIITEVSYTFTGAFRGKFKGRIKN